MGVRGFSPFLKKIQNWFSDSHYFDSMAMCIQKHIFVNNSILKFVNHAKVFDVHQSRYQNHCRFWHTILINAWGQMNPLSLLLLWWKLSASLVCPKLVAAFSKYWDPGNLSSPLSINVIKSSKWSSFWTIDSSCEDNQ